MKQLHQFLGFCALAVVLGGLSPFAAAETSSVNSTSGDYDAACEQPPDGDCTLRDAVRALFVQSDSEPDVLSFAGLPGTGPWVIELTSNVTIQTTPDVVLDGFSAPGYAGTPLVELRLGNSLSVVTAGATVRGLALPNGLSISANDAWVYANYLGTDQTGLLPGTANTGVDSIRYMDIGAYEFQGTTVNCPADTDGDGDVDLSDLALLLSEFGQNGAALSGDADGDGDVDLTDLAIVLGDFGQSC